MLISLEVKFSFAWIFQ